MMVSSGDLTSYTLDYPSGLLPKLPGRAPSHAGKLEANRVPS